MLKAFFYFLYLSILSLAAWADDCPPRHDPTSLLTPVVVFETSHQHFRINPNQYAQDHKLDPAKVEKAFAAIGLLECGGAHGAAQVTCANNELVTAAHVIYDESGILRGNGNCHFTQKIDGKDVVTKIDINSLSKGGNFIAGTENPYLFPMNHDWAVLRVAGPIAPGMGVVPYQVAPSGEAKENQEIFMAAIGHSDWGEARQLSLQDCHAHRITRLNVETYNTPGNHTYNLDCDGADGASGSSVFIRTGPDAGKMIGHYEAWRSNHPYQILPYSQNHTNVFVGIDGDYAAAIKKLCSSGDVSKPVAPEMLQAQPPQRAQSVSRDL